MAAPLIRMKHNGKNSMRKKCCVAYNELVAVARVCLTVCMHAMYANRSDIIDMTMDLVPDANDSNIF